MRRRQLIITFITVFMVATSNAQTRRRQPHVAKDDASVAIENVWQAFNIRASKCGTSYFTRMGGRELEMKSCSPVLRAVKPITEADRLNGLFWAGQVAIQCTAWRNYPGGQWYDWDYFLMHHGYLLSFDVWKTRNGFHNKKHHGEQFVKLDCPGAPNSKVRQIPPSNSYWTVDLHKSDGWFDTGIQVKADQQANVVVDDSPILRVADPKVYLRLRNSGRSFLLQEDPASSNTFRTVIYFVKSYDVGKYRRCLEDEMWMAVKPNWSDTIKLKIDSSNPVGRIKMDIFTLPVVFKKGNCMVRK